MDVSQIFILTGAISASALTVLALLHRPRSLPQWAFLFGLLMTALEGWLQFLSLRSVAFEQMMLWQRLAAFPVAAFPVVWLVFSLTYARGNATVFVQSAISQILLVGGLPLLLVSLTWRVMITDAEWFEGPGHWRFPVTGYGLALRWLLLIGLILTLAHLERTYRAAVGTAKWKVKYGVFGLAIWAGTRIFTCSQVIIYQKLNVNLIILNSLGAVLASFCFGLMLFRAKVGLVDVYPSPKALYKSVSFIFAGVYLIGLGFLAKAVELIGGAGGFPYLPLVMVVGVFVLGILVLSDRFRVFLRRFLVRHFQRPEHDYRDIWSRFSLLTGGVLNPRDYSQRMVVLVSETFEALSVTLWLVDPSQRHFTYAASTSLSSSPDATPPIPDEVYSEVLQAVSQSPQALPVDLDRSSESWCQRLRTSNPVWFPKVGGHRSCLPLTFNNHLVGLLVVGDRIRGIPFSIEDLELLKCLGDQMAAGLMTQTLSARLVQASEMEAFQTMSAFLVHDLKNTASALSLTLRNLPVHFDNPAFRADALRTLSRSVQRVNELIARLSSLRQKLELHRVPTDLNQLIVAALQAVGDHPGISILRDFQPLPRILLDATQIESVVVNLILNARESIVEKGEIRISTCCRDDHAVLTVRDNGCGMSPDFLTQSLFKPFKTSKKTGIGIGMYQTKTIVEAHGGRISVESKVNEGTTFLVHLPLQK